MNELEMIKRAAFAEELEKLAGPLGIAATIAGIAAGGYLIESLINIYQDRLEAEEAEAVFEKVYKETPELNKYPKKTVEKYFESLAHHSPRVALDPVATRAYLLQMVPWEDAGGGVPVDHYLNLAQITQKNPVRSILPEGKLFHPLQVGSSIGSNLFG